MKVLIAAILVSLGFVLAPVAAAGPLEDQRCSNQAFKRGSHMQGGKKVNHEKYCKEAEATDPWNY